MVPIRYISISNLFKFLFKKFILVLINKPQLYHIKWYFTYCMGYIIISFHSCIRIKFLCYVLYFLLNSISFFICEEDGANIGILSISKFSSIFFFTF